MPTTSQLAIATRMGRRYAEAGKAITECPYNANGTPADKVLARRFVHAYNGVAEPTDVSFDSD